MKTLFTINNFANAALCFYNGYHSTMCSTAPAIAQKFEPVEPEDQHLNADYYKKIPFK